MLATTGTGRKPSFNQPRWSVAVERFKAALPGRQARAFLGCHLLDDALTGNYPGQKSASGTSLLISPKPVYGQLQLGDNART
jgi:hypothetical protein